MSELQSVLPGLFDPQDDARRSEQRRAKKKRKQRRRRRAVITILLFVIVVGGGVGGAYIGLAPTIRKLMEPKDYTGTGSGEVQVKVPPGASGRSISRVLAEAGVVKTQVAFIKAFSANKQSASIQPGTYRMRKQMSAASAITLMLDPKSRLTISVTIPEGARAKGIYAVLAKQLDLPEADFAKAATSGSIGLPAAAKGRPEGFLFPATYNFQPDTTATEALSDMVKRGRNAYAELNIPASKLRAVVTTASIIQAEAGDQEYMGKVSRVLANRLKKDYPLQLDSTVSYAVQKFNITTTPADRASTSRFNTYRYAGLPIGPISNPGEDALEAALKPTPGKWFFFVTVNPDTGETKFAVTAAQHNQQKVEFQKWLRAHPGR